MNVNKSFTLSAMQDVARSLAKLVNQGDVITLNGEVGTGKTTFARALISSLALGAPEVTSPTFALMQSYDVTLAGQKPAMLWHLDLYRLESARDAQALGLDELWKDVVMIEWPEIIAAQLPSNRLDITFEGSAADARMLTLMPHGAWREKLNRLG